MYSIKKKLPEFPYFYQTRHNNWRMCQKKIILKQCWLLLPKSIDQKQIKIWDNCLYLSNKLYGKVSQSQANSTLQMIQIP